MNNTIKIYDNEYELFCSTAALSEISDKCGGIEKLADWLNCKDLQPPENSEDSGDIKPKKPVKPKAANAAVTFDRVCEITEIMVNAAISRDNYAAKYGFAIECKKRELFESGALRTLLNPAQVLHAREAIFDTIANGMNVEIPAGANVKKSEVDADLEEIRAAKAKNGDCAE